MEISGWERLAVHAIGGLIGIGIAGNEASALVVSWQGRGIYELDSGKRIDRNNEATTVSSTWIDQGKRRALGIGPLENIWVNIFGLWGGELQSGTGGWKVELNEPEGRKEIVLSNQTLNKIAVIDKPITDVRALGFSDSGRFLFIATSSDFTIWKMNTHRLLQ